MNPPAANAPASGEVTAGFFTSPIFRVWYGAMMAAWVILFAAFSSIGFFLANLEYPAIMVLGAFVAGLTPEGGGAVAFPVLSLFFDIDRSVARDFSLMIQSVGMTSASVWILTRKGCQRADYLPVLWLLPVAFSGFVTGMHLLQAIPTHIIQALFLSLITTFALAYIASGHRGSKLRIAVGNWHSVALLLLVPFVGGLCASLFGTGADILMYTLLVTHFRMQEKIATHMSIMLMAAISLFGFAYRLGWEGTVSDDQISAWLCAFPVVLLMAPLGSFVLTRLDVTWMLRAVVALNLFQMGYFNLRDPSLEKIALSACFSALLFALFWFTLARMKRRDRQVQIS